MLCYADTSNRYCESPQGALPLVSSMDRKAAEMVWSTAYCLGQMGLGLRLPPSSLLHLLDDHNDNCFPLFASLTFSNRL